jgi:hypothetical protein
VEGSCHYGLLVCIIWLVGGGPYMYCAYEHLSVCVCVICVSVIPRSF